MVAFGGKWQVLASRIGILILVALPRGAAITQYVLILLFYVYALFVLLFSFCGKVGWFQVAVASVPNRRKFRVSVPPA